MIKFINSKIIVYILNVNVQMLSYFIRYVAQYNFMTKYLKTKHLMSRTVNVSKVDERRRVHQIVLITHC